MEKEIYLDNSATTKIRDEVLKEMLPYLKENYGNPSSKYLLGQKNREAIDISREKIANLINAKESFEVYFTSCGTESNNMIINGIAYKRKDKGKHIITTKIEHKSVLNTCKSLEEEGFEITYLNVDENGEISIKELNEKIREDTILISIMFVNNEIGTIQNIKEIGQIAKFNDIPFHVDAVQAMSNIKIDVIDMNIGALSMSAHKFNGPKGIGVAYVSKEIEFKPLILGGSQENFKRAGTENVASIVGMAKALEITVNELEKHNQKMFELRNYFLNRLNEEKIEFSINGSIKNRIFSNLNIYIKNVDVQNLITYLDIKNIYVSSVSACNTNSNASSYVLKAIGKNEEIAKNSLRLTFGNENTKEDVDYLIQNIKDFLNIKDTTIN